MDTGRCTGGEGEGSAAGVKYVGCLLVLRWLPPPLLIHVSSTLRRPFYCSNTVQQGVFEGAQTLLL